ncbi:MAG: Uma2 family endonuclease [Dehalococcoidia bacterium]|nr:Uma2 family endonuclease [Dehalococcoidia bacterium]
MVGKTTTPTRTHTELERFPEFPPRDDMNNPIYLYRPSYIYALELHMGNPETTIVLGEVPVGWTPRQSAGVRRPDLLIADNVNRAVIIEQWGYAIEQQGKPPDFVLEVASATTGGTDYTAKRRDYEAYGIPEYWRFDPSGGEYHDAALAGDRLVDGAYQTIEIEWLDENRCRGYSEFLGLYVCWEYGELRWYDPKTESYLRTHADDVERAETERVARTFAEERADRAEIERDREAAAREQEAAARREAEAEVERLRRRLEDIGDPQ